MPHVLTRRKVVPECGYVDEGICPVIHWYEGGIWWATLCLVC